MKFCRLSGPSRNESLSGCSEICFTRSSIGIIRACSSACRLSSALRFFASSGPGFNSLDCCACARACVRFLTGDSSAVAEDCGCWAWKVVKRLGELVVLDAEAVRVGVEGSTTGTTGTKHVVLPLAMQILFKVMA